MPLSQINCCSQVPRCSVCETHDPTGEPSAGNPPAGFGERRLETELRRGVRHRHGESRRQQLPPIAYRHRASRRLYKLCSFRKSTGARGCHGVPCARHTPHWESAGNPSAQIGEWRLKTGPWRERNHVGRRLYKEGTHDGNSRLALGGCGAAVWGRSVQPVGRRSRSGLASKDRVGRLGRQESTFELKFCNLAFLS